MDRTKVVSPFHGNQQIFETQEQNKFSTPFNLFFSDAMFALCRMRIENSFLVKEVEKPDNVDNEMIRTRNQFCAIISWKCFLETIFAVQISVMTGTKEKKNIKKRKKNYT